MPRLLVTGATGQIGRAIVPRLKNALIASRDPVAARSLFPGREIIRPSDPLPGDIDAVLHLAAEPIVRGRWTTARKAAIRASRVDGTRRLVAALAAAGARPRVFVSASATGFYGSRGDDVLTEDSPAGSGFWPEVVSDWEHEAAHARDLGARVVTLRIGAVLAPTGGLLEKQIKTFKRGLGGVIGDGSAWMSWIHLDDLVEAALFVLSHERLEGAVNAVAPTPVTNAEFASGLSRALHRPSFFNVPHKLLAAALGEVATAVLASQRVSSRKLQRGGFGFRHVELDATLRDIARLAPAERAKARA